MADYDGKHQAEKKRLNPIVLKQGAQCTELVCLMPSRDIPPGTRSNHWDLAHDRRVCTETPHTCTAACYLGPAHTTCNRGEGARHMHERADTRSRWVL